jgi:hypothetical protein
MLFVDLAVPAALPKTRPGGLKPDAATMPFPFVCVWSTGACRSFRAARPTAATREPRRRLRVPPLRMPAWMNGAALGVDGVADPYPLAIDEEGA